MSEIITVTGTVEEIIYSNPDNGYSVVGIDSIEEGQFTATGYMPFITEGESVALSGNWTTHPDYGEQFKAEYYETVMPPDEESIIKYLSSGIISGIREATAKKLVDHFGLDVLQIMLTQPSKLAEIKGISKEKAKKIGEQFAEIQSMQNIVMFLQQYGISATTAVKVHNSLGANSVELIKKNPYILSDMVDGISFKTSDTIAFNMGLPKNSIMRIRSGIIHILRSAAYTSGHVYMPKDVLIEHTVYTLKVTDDEVIAAVSELLSSKELFQDKVDGIDAYYLYSYYESEYYIARRLIAMSQNTQKFTMTEEKAEKAIDALEAKTNLYLAAEQRNAVVTALSAGCMILTGGPGTGKTTLALAFSKALGLDYKRIQFTTDTLPSDIVGFTMLNNETQKFEFRPGAVFSNLLLADEINRAPAKVQSALLEAMQERQVTIGKETFMLPEPFLVLATQNPIEQEGTYPLPEAQVDRFMLKVVIDYPKLEEEKLIIRQNINGEKFNVKPILRADEIIEARKVVRQVYLDEKIERYIVDIVFATRFPEKYDLKELKDMIGFGGSPRASINLALAARTYAFIKRRGYVIPEDVRAVAHDVLRHRIGLTYEAEANNMTSDEIISKILNKVEVP